MDRTDHLIVIQVDLDIAVAQRIDAADSQDLAFVDRNAMLLHHAFRQLFRGNRTEDAAVLSLLQSKMYLDHIQFLFQLLRLRF